MNKKLLNIETIRKYILKRDILWTRHCLNRLNQRNITVVDVKRAIINGEIIEYYFDDYPYPSCLILGYNLNNIAIHIVCSISEELVYMITVYYPDNKDWKEDKKTRRKNDGMF